MAHSENAVCRICLELLAMLKIPAWRNNSGAVTTGGRFVRFGAPGSPDIIGLLPKHGGRWLGIECKTATGRQTPSQKQFQAAVEAAGGLYLLVRDVNDLVSALGDMDYMS